MPIRTRHLTVVLAVAALACGVSGCGTVNEKLGYGVADYLPHWLGGEPADVPPRPGTAKYEEFMRERERKRLESGAQTDQAGQSQTPQSQGSQSQASPSPLDPVH
jgi:hypothetical protein